MKTSKNQYVGLAAALLLLGSSVANAANITINDNNTGSNGNNEVASGWYKGGATYMATPGATDALSEYQEVEPGMNIGSQWDLAAFVNPGAGALGIVSGYDLANGYGGTTIGDIMVSVNPAGLNAYADPGTPYPQYVGNSAYNFDFAVKFDFTGGVYHYTVLKLDAHTLMENGEYNSSSLGYPYNSASQPWRVATSYATGYTAADGYNLGTVVTTGVLAYSNDYAAYASAQTGYSVTSDYKFYAQISTTWLNPFLNATNPVALYKLTMSCGNDNMLGVQTTGFNQVPDGSATLALLGLSFLGLVGAAKLKSRKTA